MRVAVIVATYNRAAMLGDALDSLLRQERDPDCALELLVVDNASTDATRAVVESRAARAALPVRYVREPARGVAHARRRGVEEAAGEWLAFFDDDQVADPRWLGELLAAARASGARCVGGRVALEPGDPRSPPLPAFCRGLLGETPDADGEGPYANKRLPGTGNVLVHRSAYDAVGPFDPALEQGAEDADLFRRLRAAGFVLWYAPRARVVHRVPAYRTSPEYLRWVARRHGSAYAVMDAKEGGRARVLSRALLRGAQALAWTWPGLLRARVAGDAGALLDRGCRLARTAGYARQALRLVAPRAFAQSRFFSGLDFRSERTRFA